MDVLALNEKYKISNGTPGFYHFIFHKIHSKSFCVHRTRIDMQSSIRGGSSSVHRDFAWGLVVGTVSVQLLRTAAVHLSKAQHPYILALYVLDVMSCRITLIYIMCYLNISVFLFYLKLDTNTNYSLVCPPLNVTVLIYHCFSVPLMW